MQMIERIEDAKDFLQGRIVLTPVLPAENLCDAKQTYLKAENLQKTGSFKIRGAYYRISRLSEEEKKRGVIACSAGNHAQGVALAAKEQGIACTICMPEAAPISKIVKTKGYGANVVLVAGGFDDAMVTARQLEKEHGYVFIHPFDDPDIIAGQGTIGLEILEQVPNVDIILVAVGGGGMLAGISAAVKALKPSCQIYGVEPSQAASMKLSIDKNSIETLTAVHTVADGVAVKCPGNETFSLCRQYADGFVTVGEGQITLAMLRLLEDYKIVAEGAGAAPVAAALYGKVDLRGKTVVCVVSGGNVDVNLLERIIAKGLRKTGRVMSFATVISDRPRQLHDLLEIMGQQGANILAIHHERSDLEVHLDECVVHITFETRDAVHQKAVVSALEEHGYLVKEE